MRKKIIGNMHVCKIANGVILNGNNNALCMRNNMLMEASTFMYMKRFETDLS